MNRYTEKRPPAFLKGIPGAFLNEIPEKEKGGIETAPDYTGLVNDVTQSLEHLAEHLETLKGRLGPILKYNAQDEPDKSYDPDTKETMVSVGLSRFRIDMATISSVIRLITDEVRWISREVDL